MELFLAVATRIADKLALPVAIASHKIAGLIVAAKDMEHLRAMLSELKTTWSACCDRFLTTSEFCG